MTQRRSLTLSRSLHWLSFHIAAIALPFLALALAACGAVSTAKEGRVAVTPLANGQYDIYSVGGIISDRSLILQKWEAAASETCKGPYELLGEQRSGQSPAGMMSVEGRIRCSRTPTKPDAPAGPVQLGSQPAATAHPPVEAPKTGGQGAAPTSGSTSPTPEPMSVSEMQKILLSLGYQPGPVDGALGRRTIEALRKFQQDQKLLPTGRLDSETALRLRQRASK